MQQLRCHKGSQLRQDLRKWFSPLDPSTNHNIVCGAYHKRTAEWFFQGAKIKKWKSTGSLLWIHGKRAFLLPYTLAPPYAAVFSQRDRARAYSGSSVLSYLHFKALMVVSAPPSSKKPFPCMRPDLRPWRTSTLISGT